MKIFAMLVPLYYTQQSRVNYALSYVQTLDVQKRDIS